MLENRVFRELRRRNKTLYYVNENHKECDFVVCSNLDVEEVIQVCYDLNLDNQKREINGLLDAAHARRTGTSAVILSIKTDSKIRNEF